nr:hypothetical protein [uncultured Allomuricauda sp.]
MNEKKIEEIVRKVYDEARKGCVSGAKNALAIHVEEEIFKNHKENISYKTVERAFRRHVFKDKTVSESNPESINLFCKYLGFQDYSDYIKKSDKKKRRLTITIGVVFSLTILVFSTQKWPLNVQKNNSNVLGCMTWADSLYVKVSCKMGPLSQYGTKVEPLIETKLESMRKVSVDAAYQFFTEDGKPLIWYFKNENNEHEFFTSPGLHPVTGETLRKITPYIIQTYVPIHKYKKESFVQ